MPPFHLDTRGGRVSMRHVEHAGIEVQAHDVRKVVKPLCGDPRDNARPARRIQDPVACMECHVCEHQFSQGPAKRLHRLAFI